MTTDNNHPPVKFGKIGVLMVNLGTPDSTSWRDIRKYLKEFLSDKRVIEVNPIIWQLILNIFILTFTTTSIPSSGLKSIFYSKRTLLNPISTPFLALIINAEVILDMSIPNFSKELKLILYSFQSPLILKSNVLLHLSISSH